MQMSSQCSSTSLSTPNSHLRKPPVKTSIMCAPTEGNVILSPLPSYHCNSQAKRLADSMGSVPIVFFILASGSEPRTFTELLGVLQGENSIICCEIVRLLVWFLNVLVSNSLYRERAPRQSV